MPDPAPVAMPTALFSHNWREQFSLASAYPTADVAALSTDEARWGLSDKPTRSLRVRGLTLAPAQAGALKAQLRRATGGRFYAPLSCDETLITGGGPTVWTCDTSDRRFFVGFKAMIVVLDADQRATSMHVATINAITSTTITLATSPGFTVPAGARLYPAVECDVDLSAELKPETDWYVTFDLTLTERVGATALPALVAAESLPAGEPTYQGLPVLVIPHDWNNLSEGEVRKATSSQVGLGLVTEVYGTSSVVSGSMSFLALNRVEAFRLLRFFDSRGGSVFPFWLPSSTADLIPTARTSGSIWVVSKAVDISDIAARRFLGFWDSLGACYVRRITDITDLGTTWQITVDSSVPIATLTDLVRLSFASLARFDTDSIEEQWSTDATMSAKLSLVGVRANATGTGEEGDSGFDDPFPPIDPPTTGEDSEPPWEPIECEAAGVMVPMFFDSTQAANSKREPIRAADLNMPKVIRVRFKQGWVNDSLHPHSPALSQDLIDTLTREHFLEYAGTLPAGYSRNPYHARLTSSNWVCESLPGVPVVREAWTATREYTSGDNTYTLEVRLVAEYSTDAAKGAHGTLFCLYVFTDECVPTYVDGTNYAPFNSIPFTRNDPFVWGLHYSLDPDIKRCHPQMVACAIAATTLHAPVGSAWVPPDRTRFSSCYSLPNGAPWSSGSPDDAADNSVFGTANHKTAMSLGADINSPIADFFEWLCAENGLGQGTTGLKPTRAGWDEAEGNLSVQAGNDLAIRVCSPGQSLQRISLCDGNPEEPLDAIGGTHGCFKTKGGDDFICVSTSVPSTVDMTEQCVTIRKSFDASCTIIDFSCSYSPMLSDFEARLWDYSYALDTAPTDRFISWKGFYDDPSYERQSWVYTPATPNLSNWSQAIGSWTFGSTFTITAVNAGATPKALALLSVSGHTFDDCSVDYISEATAAIVGAVFRYADNGFGAKNGYLTQFDRVADRVRIYRMDAGVLTLLGQKAGHGFTSAQRVHLVSEVLGSSIKLSWGTAGSSGMLGSLEVFDCTYETGGVVGVAGYSTTSGSQFTSLQITDNNWRKVEVEVSASPTEVAGSVDPSICTGALSGTCDSHTTKCPRENPPSDMTCNGPCESTDKGVSGLYSITSLDYPAPAQVPDGINPDPVCFEAGCSPPLPPCGDCPPPFRSIAVRLPSSCEPTDAPSTNLFKKGVDGWDITYIACP